MSAGTSRYGDAALGYELGKVERCVEGIRHHTLFKASCALGELAAGGELDESETRAALEAAGRQVGLPGVDVRRQVGRGLERGRRHPRRAPEHGPCLVDTDRTEILGQLVVWWHRASAAKWPGQAGSTRLRIVAGLFLLATGAGKVDLADSLRQVSEATGVSHATIWRHRAALAPWVRVVSKGRRNGGRHRWRLCLSAGTSASAQNETSRPTRQGNASGLFQGARLPERQSLSSPAHDVWGRWSGGWRLFCLLDADDGLTTRDLAAATGYHVGTIRRSMNKMAAMGLAERDGDRQWRSVSCASPREEDVSDLAARRRALHQRQRVQHRLYKAAAAAAREHVRDCSTAPPGADPETGEIASLRPRAVADSFDPRGDGMVTRPPDTGPDLRRRRRRRTGYPMASPARDERPGEGSWAP